MPAYLGTAEAKDLAGMGLNYFTSVFFFFSEMNEDTHSLLSHMMEALRLPSFP